VVNAIRMRGVTDNLKVCRLCISCGLIAVSLMAVIYGSLSYIGATSAEVLGHSPNGGVLLADAARLFFGTSGNLLLAVIIAFACLTTSCGMVSACAWFFNNATHNRISYQRVVLFSSVFAFVFSNVGLTELISISVPFLVAIYPNIIVLVILSLFSHWIGERRIIYRSAVAFTLPFCILDGINAAGLQPEFLQALLSQYIPFYTIMLGWFVPALAGTGAGFLISLFQKEHEPAPLRMKDL